MAKTVYRLIPCPSYDVERIESWLSDMAREGLLLNPKDPTLDFFSFTPGEPKAVRYRLEPKEGLFEDSSPESDVRDMFREYGWEFVCGYGQFYIFRDLSPDARELNTDTKVQALSLKIIVKRTLFWVALHIFLYLDSFSRLFQYPFRGIATLGAFYVLGFWVLLLGTGILILKQILHILRLQKQLRKNIPLDHSKPWRKSAVAQRCFKLLWSVFYVVLLSVMITQCTVQVTDGQSMEDYTGDPPFVTMGDLAEGTYKKAGIDLYEILPEDSPMRQHSAIRDLQPILGNAVETGSTLFAPVFFDWSEKAEITLPNGEILSGALDILYYETVSPWFAAGLAEDLLRYDRETFYRVYELLEPPALDADQVVLCRIYQNGPPQLLIREGCQVILAEVDIQTETKEELLLLWAQMQLARMKEGTANG